MAVAALSILDATLGRTFEDCIVESKSVQLWTTQGHSPWTIETSCGSFDVKSEQGWSRISIGASYSIDSTGKPLDNVRTARKLTL